jgi:hypothetical protein
MKVTKLLAAMVIACAAVPTVGLSARALADDSAKPAASRPRTHFTSLDYRFSDFYWIDQDMTPHEIVRREIEIDEAGNVLSKRRKKPDVRGRATREELARLRAAWDDAHLGVGDCSVDDLSGPLPAKTLFYNFRADERPQTDLAGFFTENRTPSAVTRIVAVMESIADRLEKMHTESFSKISLHTQNPRGMLDATIAIDEKGKVVYHPGRDKAEIDAQATPAELEAVKKAFAQANVMDLPKNVSIRFVADGSTFDLASTIGAKTFESFGYDNGMSDAVARRVKPLLDAINAIRLRLDRPAATTTTGIAGGMSHP